MTRAEALLIASGAFATCGVCTLGAAVVSESGILKNLRPIETPINPAILATMTPVSQLAPVCGPTETPSPTKIVKVETPKPVATKVAVVKETFLTCDQIKNGGPVRVSKPMPEVPVSSLKALWPNAIVQNAFGSAIHSLVTQEPGAIVFSPDQKGNPDLEKVVKDGYAFWIGKDNQWVLGSKGTVNVADNATTLMASFGEGSLRIGDRTYYFPQEDTNGGTEYIVVASVKGNRKNITSVEADCLIPNHNQFNVLPNGRPDVPASTGFLEQQVQNSLKRANRVVFVTIDPDRDVMTQTEKFRSGDWRLLGTNVNVNK